MSYFYNIFDSPYRHLAPHLDQKGARDAFIDDYARRYIPGMLREARCAAGLSQEQLAKRLGVGQQSVARLEREGNTSISLKTLVRFAKALDIGLCVEFQPFSRLVWGIEGGGAEFYPYEIDKGLRLEKLRERYLPKEEGDE